MTTQIFVTEAGLEVPAITTDQMREVDRVAIEEVGPNLYQMMENAGRSLALTVLDRLGDDWATTPIAVLAGTGGNGGGGICAARHLVNRGADVTVVISDEERLASVPDKQLAVYRGTNGKLVRIDELGALRPGLVVDAVIGYSLGGAPRGTARRMIDWMGDQSAPVVSLDVPSGIDSTTGEAPGDYVQAAVTLTLALPKTGLDVAAAGDLMLADIGIPAEVYRRVGIDLPAGIFGAGYRVTVRPT
ncbi:MAG: NAD(P)H-hydrate epimerase [Acidimicrobiia bacterium]|nr:NAD(P)H-hydrate epimerase [Acidimicrobiia bacterium]